MSTFSKAPWNIINNLKHHPHPKPIQHILIDSDYPNKVKYKCNTFVSFIGERTEQKRSARSCQVRVLHWCWAFSLKIYPKFTPKTVENINSITSPLLEIYDTAPNKNDNFYTRLWRLSKCIEKSKAIYIVKKWDPTLPNSNRPI